MLAPRLSSCHAARWESSESKAASSTLAFAFSCMEKGRSLSSSRRHCCASCAESSVGGLTARRACSLAKASLILPSACSACPAASSPHLRQSHSRPTLLRTRAARCARGSMSTASSAWLTVTSSPRGMPSAPTTCRTFLPLGKPCRLVNQAAFGRQLCLMWLQKAYTPLVPSGFTRPNRPKMEATRTKWFQKTSLLNSGRSLTNSSTPALLAS
mmetsp:Transcript_41947/g.125473  ORF Transcript_41947/g.125473 Transcript_41947/m.125473 type:complete len:213 (-) Transcript_41947:432-1070(-)